MKKILLLILFFINITCIAQNTVNNYQPTFLPIFGPDNKLAIAIRVFDLNNVANFLIVNPDSLQTSIIPVQLMQPSPNNHPSILFKDMIGTRYYKLLMATSKPPYSQENYGIKHAINKVKANVLTIDLCPTNKHFERGFFKKLVKIANTNKKPIPITIAISGRWLKTHAQEFAWLLNQALEKNLQITWANHTFSHVYYQDLEYSKNFILSPRVNISAEVLMTERYLIENGAIPSVFFRFPGLISDKKLVKKINILGLIPLGADAWLAKDEKINPGSIILVHGNHNEHSGILLIMPILDKLNLIDIHKAI